MKKKYNTCEEIKKAFIEDGWSDDIEFDEYHDEDYERWHDEKMTFYVMRETGNIYDQYGKIYQYNIKACLNY